MWRFAMTGNAPSGKAAYTQTAVCFTVLCIVHGAVFSAVNFIPVTGKVPVQKEAAMLMFEFELPQGQEISLGEIPPEPAQSAVLAEAPDHAPVETAAAKAAVSEDSAESSTVLTEADALADSTESSAAIAGAEALTDTAESGAVGAGQGRRISESDYIALVMRRLEEKKVYPLAMRKRGIEGDMPVRFTIRADGTLAQVTADSGGVHPFLAQAALETVRSASPFPVMEGREDDLSLQVTIKYQLEQQ